MTQYAIDKPTPRFQAQHELTKLPRTIMGGTQAMRRVGKANLPEKAAETAQDYLQRLARSVLINYLAKTLDYLDGQVFQKPLDYISQDEIGTATYDQKFFDVFKEDVDLAGNNLSSFGMNFFRDAVLDGVAYLLVDYSQVETREDENGALMYRSSNGEWLPKTLDADRENGWRPYFVKIQVGQVLDAWTTVDNGEARLRYFRYAETIEEAVNGNPLERISVTRIRVFEPGKWELHEIREGELSATLVASGKTPLDYIPIFEFMPGGESDEAIALPPLADLAEMNRAHWEAYSDHLTLARWGRCPVWFGVNLAGGDTEKNIEFGPSRFIHAGNVDSASLQSVGIEPSSISNSLDDLKKMEDYMEDYGLQVALNPAGYATATQIATVANASDSQLKGWCVEFQDTLENALKTVAEYEGREDGPAVFVNTSFRQTFDASKASALKAMRNDQDLSRETYLEETKRMGLLSDEIDVKEEIERIRADQEMDYGMNVNTMKMYNDASVEA
ncbi:hypothetical protein C4J81_13780 [Deltaproteobacteria bacterium Smac51]|nr:hypothetical protein C4J81_13780 [Deltaproteobacteria bacterium Smac51]